jgi:hypothetical protein
MKRATSASANIEYQVGQIARSGERLVSERLAKLILHHNPVEPQRRTDERLKNWSRCAGSSLDSPALWPRSDRCAAFAIPN